MGENKILVVEDENVTATYLKRLLEKLGYTVVDTVDSGEKAVAAAKEFLPHCILMDIKLSGEMDGIEAAGIIYRETKIPVIYITAFTEKEILERAKISKPYGYLLKPINERELHVIIEIALYRNEVNRKLEEHQVYLEEQVKERTKELSKTIEKLNKEIKVRKRVEEELKKSEEQLMNRSRVIENDLRYAQMIQKELIKIDLPRYGEMDIDYRYLPLDAIGGDYFSFTKLSEGGLGVFIGDVENHGVSASLFISLIKFMTNKVCRQFGLDPALYLNELNQNLIGNMATSFLTALYVLFQYGDENVLNVKLSIGGHPYPVIHRPASKEVSCVEITGPLIGYFDDAEFEEIAIDMQKGDRLYIYTDGLMEIMDCDDKLLGYEGLMAIIGQTEGKTLSEALDFILQEVNKFTDSSAFRDDVLLIGIEN